MTNDMIDSKRTWVYDKLSYYKYEEEGIAELERKYLDTPESNEDHSIFKWPIVARGITAFLGESSITSFKCSMKSSGLNRGKPAEAFFEKYYNHCIKILRQIDHFSTPFEDERKSETELTWNHLEKEKMILDEPQIFYSEYYEPDKKIIEDIKKAAYKYLDWLKETSDLSRMTELKIPVNIKSKGLSLPEIALICHYTNQIIDSTTGKQILQRYNSQLQSCRKLIEKYNLYHPTVNRTNLSGSEKTDSHKEKLLIKVVSYLESNNLEAGMAKHDLKKLSDLINSKL